MSTKKNVIGKDKIVRGPFYIASSNSDPEYARDEEAMAEHIRYLIEHYEENAGDIEVYELAQDITVEHDVRIKIGGREV